MKAGCGHIPPRRLKASQVTYLGCPLWSTVKTMTRKTLVKVTILVFLITVVVGFVAALQVRNSFVPSVDYSTLSNRGPQRVINAPGGQAVVTVPGGNKGRVQELFADFNSVVKRGQRPSYIHLQFLTESGVPSLTGGISGRFIGGSAAAAFAWYFEWPSLVPTLAIAIAFGFSTADRRLLRILPGRPAAVSYPIETLR